MFNNLLEKPGLNLLAEDSSLVRVIIFLLAWMIIWLPVAIPLARRLKWHIKEPLQTEQKVPLLLSLYIIAPGILWGAIKMENSTWTDCGLELKISLIIWFVIGLLLGILGLGLLLGIEKALNWLEWKPENLTNLGKIAIPILGLSITIGMVEELIFRGWIVFQLNKEYNYWIAGAIASVIFALLHLIWERKKTLPQLPGLWLMGMVLTIARLTADGNIGLAWGLHTGWVWVLASVSSAELISYSDRPSPWLIGFYREPLAGLIGLTMMCVTGIICYSMGQI